MLPCLCSASIHPEPSLPPSLLTPLLPEDLKYKLASIGHDPITNIRIHRSPLGIKEDIVNLLSIGQFDKLKSKMGYEDFFHLSIVVNIKSQLYRVEKVQNVHIINDIFREEDENIIYQVDLIENEKYDLTLIVLFEKMLLQFGEEKIYLYDFVDNNCQHFIHYLLLNIKSYDKNAKLFVLQNVDELSNLYPYVLDFLDQLTSTCGVLDREVQKIEFFNPKSIIHIDDFIPLFLQSPMSHIPAISEMLKNNA